MRKRTLRSTTVGVIWENEEFQFRERQIDVVANLVFRCEPGDPGCWRTPNGDGWPPTPPEYELQSVRIARTHPAVDDREFSTFAECVKRHLAEAEECDTKEWKQIIEDVNREIEGDDYCD